MKPTAKSKSKPARTPAFVARGERAMRRAAQNVRAQHRAYGLPIIVWEDGKMVEKPA